MTEPPAYAELHAHSYFSLLDGVSSPEALVTRAQELGLAALALTDHASLAGAVRFWQAARRAVLPAVIGAEVTLAAADPAPGEHPAGGHLTLLAETQQGYANLCQLLTAARLAPFAHQPPDTPWPGKIAPHLTWAQLATHSRGLLALTGCRQGPLAAPLLRGQTAQAHAALHALQAIFGPDHLFIELQHHALPDDDRLIRALLDLANAAQLRVVATQNVHYATPAASPLRDAVIAIRHHESLTAARQAGHLPPNRTYHLASPAEMAHRFRALPLALATSVELAQRCHVSLDFSAQRLPRFSTPDGSSEFAYLYQRCHANLPQRYPHLTPPVLKQLAHELAVIERAGLAGYFLIVADLMDFARAQGIRAQGRGSAANSLVAYLLRITNIDPLAHDLLFERFLSEDKFTMPDIDIDFAADRREEIIQYVYQTYGRAHTAMVCNVVTYQARSAVRDLAKVLDFPPQVIDQLAGPLDTAAPALAAEQLLAQVDPAAPPHHPLRLLASLVQQIDGLPRHLSIHSGGMLITGLPLHEVVPLEPATLPGRMVAQWNKESVEDAGLIKLDLLALRTLSLITEAVALSAAHGQTVPDLATLPLDDPALYALLQSGDTIGAFQVESRAQQQMLPHLKPTHFAEIAIEIAIVRPGPIQGGAVHPYLRRRLGLEPVRYLHPSLEPVLQSTLGVLLFQEQAIRIAVTVAGFTPGEADLLRRALSRPNATTTLAQFEARFRQGAAQQGIDAATAHAIFAQLAGFAGYGFCQSHAMSFALIAYQTLYLKHYHAPAFYCALFNQQSMGFYAPAVLVGDAQRHGVTLLPPAVNQSAGCYTLERTGTGALALRTGLQTVAGLGATGWQRIATARQAGPFADLADFCHRTRLPTGLVSNLIRAGACAAWGPPRALLWQLGTLVYTPEGFALTTPTTTVDLPPLEAVEQTTWEYELLGVAPSGQIMHHYRAALRRAGVLSTWEVKTTPRGRRVQVAGLVVIRQRPPTANGLLFLSLEDESGLLDLIIQPTLYAQHKATLRSQPLLCFTGIVQRAATATSVLVETVETLSAHLNAP